MKYAKWFLRIAAVVSAVVLLAGYVYQQAGGNLLPEWVRMPRSASTSVDNIPRGANVEQRFSAPDFDSVVSGDERVDRTIPSGSASELGDEAAENSTVGLVLSSSKSSLVISVPPHEDPQPATPSGENADATTDIAISNPDGKNETVLLPTGKSFIFAVPRPREKPKPPPPSTNSPQKPGKTFLPGSKAAKIKLFNGENAEISTSVKSATKK